MKPLKVGFIGAGANTRNTHLPQLKKIEGVVLSEVANRTVESSLAVARDFNIDRTRDHWREVATSPSVDAVVIGTWPNLHCEATCLALEHGKHVLTEARLARNAEEARQMLMVSRRYPGLITQVVPSPFTLHADATVKSILENGQLGRLNHFFFEFSSPPSTPQGAPLHWRRNRELSGLNTMVLGIAYESLLRWLGPADWVSASGAVLNNRALDPHTRQEVPVDIPDFLTVRLQMKNSVAGTFVLTETGNTGRPSRFCLQGEKGLLEIPFKVDGELQLGRSGAAGVTWAPCPIDDSLRGRWRVEEEFVGAIRGENPIEYTTFETGVEYMVFTEAVHRSFKMDGIPVSLADI